MKALSKIAAGVSPSATLAVSALAKKMKAEGKDVIGFGAGEPDFATPDRISYAGVRAICDGKTRYRRLSPAAPSTWSILRWPRWSIRAMK